MFNVINTLKSNKVGHIPDLKEVKENEVYQKFNEIILEGPEKSFIEMFTNVKECIQTDNDSRINLEKMEKLLAHVFSTHDKWSRTVDIEKIPPTRQVQLNDEKEEELSHKMLEIASKMFEKSRPSWNKYCHLKQKRLAAIKALASAVEAEVEEFKCFSEEFKKGVEEWKGCVFRAEFSSEKIRDHFLNDPKRISIAKIETQLRIIQSTEGSLYLSSILKFLSSLEKKAVSLEKFDKKQSDMRAKLEELSRFSVENRRISLSATLAKKRQSSIESGLEVSQRDQNNYIEDLKKLCKSFLSSIHDVHDRHIIRSMITKRLGFNSLRVLEGVEFDNVELANVPDYNPDAPPNYGEEKDELNLVEEKISPDILQKEANERQQINQAGIQIPFVDQNELKHEIISRSSKSPKNSENEKKMMFQKEKDNGEEEDDEDVAEYTPLPRSPMKSKGIVSEKSSSKDVPPSPRSKLRNIIVDRSPLKKDDEYFEKKSISKNENDHSLQEEEKGEDENINLPPYSDEKNAGLIDLNSHEKHPEKEEKGLDIIIPAYLKEDKIERKSHEAVNSPLENKDLLEKSILISKPSGNDSEIQLPLYFDDHPLSKHDIMNCDESKKFVSELPDEIPSYLVDENENHSNAVFEVETPDPIEDSPSHLKYPRSLNKFDIDESHILTPELKDDLDLKVLHSDEIPQDEQIVLAPKLGVELSPDFQLNVDSPNENVSNIELPPTNNDEEEKEDTDGSEEAGEDLEIPEEFLDPISHELMSDPVVLLDDGITYDRKSISKWLDSNDVSPVTGEQLDSKDIAPNRAMKRLIEEYIFKASGAW